MGKTRLSKQQQVYAAALALRNMEKERIAKQAAQIPHDDPEWAEKVEHIYSEAGYYEHLALFHQAEQELIDWAHAQIKTLPQYAAHKADMEKVFKGAIKFPHLHAKLVDLCMRIAA